MPNNYRTKHNVLLFPVIFCVQCGVHKLEEIQGNQGITNGWDGVIVNTSVSGLVAYIREHVKKKLAFLVGAGGSDPDS